MKYWFISDTHFGHFNIIKYCNRPFKSLEKMNNTLIRNWNSRVNPEDIVFHLGDVAFYNTTGGKKGEGIRVKGIEWLKKLNGTIIVIKGNHEKNNKTKTIIEKLVIKIANKRINLVHNPIYCDFNYPINFCGHVHNKWLFKTFYRKNKKTDAINLSVEMWNYKPVDINEIMKRYYIWKNKRRKK